VTRAVARVVVRLLGAATTVAAALLPALAGAQEWGFKVGGTARSEYTDNYGLAAFNKQSATTLSVAPFVTGYRRTETSQLNLLAGIGYNYVLGLDAGNADYWTGRFLLDGSRTVERATYGFNIGIVRDTTLRTETQQTGIVFSPNNIRTGASAGVNAGYQLTERWNASAFASVYSNNYSLTFQGVVPGASSNLQNNTGYSVGGNLGYALTERTQLSWNTAYSYYSSDITDNNSINTTLAVTRQFSQRLTASAYGGYFWSDIETTQNTLICPTTPIICQLGLVAFVPVSVGTERSSTGTLFGGSINWQASERASFFASVAQNITPSGTGTITKATPVVASLSYTFTERLRGRVGGNWTRSTVPGLSATTFQTTYWSVGGGVSYDLTEAWLLDVGIRYNSSDQRGLTATGNTVYLQIAYNWPGQSLNDWAGLGAFTLPAAAPGAGIPPVLTPGLPMYAPTPVPRSAEEPASAPGGGGAAAPGSGRTE
jgi:hypothetical protein